MRIHSIECARWVWCLFGKSLFAIILQTCIYQLEGSGDLLVAMIRILEVAWISFISSISKQECRTILSDLVTVLVVLLPSFSFLFTLTGEVEVLILTWWHLFLLIGTLLGRSTGFRRVSRFFIETEVLFSLFNATRGDLTGNVHTLFVKVFDLMCLILQALTSSDLDLWFREPILISRTTGTTHGDVEVEVAIVIYSEVKDGVNLMMLSVEEKSEFIRVGRLVREALERRWGGGLIRLIHFINCL